MKTTIVLLTVALCSVTLLAADSTPKDTLLSASKNLGSKANYSWKTTVEVAGEPNGIIEGKTEKDGAAVLTLARAEVSFSGVLKGSKGAIKTEDGWKTLSDAADDSGDTGATRFVARLLQGFKAPPNEVTDLAGKVTNLKADGDGLFSATLEGETVKELLLFRTRGGGNQPEISGAKGSIKVWVKDGTLSKYEYNLQGTMSRDGNEREVNRTCTTEISEVGTTKVTVPENAAKLL